MSVISQIAEKLLGKRTVKAIQPIFDITAPIIIDLIAEQLSEGDVNQIMNACRRRLRKTVPKQ